MVFLAVHDAEHRAHHLGEGLLGVGFLLLELVQVDGDDVIGAHLLDHVDRQVVEHAAVDQVAVTDLDRREISWNRHARTDGRDDASAVPDHFLLGVEVHRHAGEGDGEGVEVDVVLIAHRYFREELVQVLAFHERSGHVAQQAFPGRAGSRRLVVEVAGIHEREAQEVFVGVLLERVGDLPSVDLVSHQQVPVL